MITNPPDGVDLLSITDPRVLGSIGAFIFLVFVYELVVSGRAYKRELEENARLRRIVETIIPLAEKMTDAIEANTATVERLADVVEDKHKPSSTRSRRP